MDRNKRFGKQISIECWNDVENDTSLMGLEIEAQYKSIFASGCNDIWIVDVRGFVNV